MNLATESLIKEESSQQIYRITFIDYKYNQIFLFGCHEYYQECKFPKPVKMDVLLKDIDKGKYSILEDDPFSKIKSRPTAEKQHLHFQKATIFFQFLVDEVLGKGFEFLMYKNTRWEIIKRACKKANVSTQTGLNWMKLLFNGGFSLDSLRPDYEKSGAPKQQRKGGIPAKFRNILTSGYLKLHLELGMFLKDAWKNTKTKIEEIENGAIKKYNITKAGFRYHGERKYSAEEQNRIRNGEIDYNNNKKMLRGRAIDNVDGPCFQYQIDSSVRDIQCVLSYDRNQFIGKATFYIVSDLWSGAIIGVFITLDSPSYVAAAYAIYIALTDKRELYKSLDLDLKHLTFNPRGIPYELIADKAELLGPKADNILKICGIKSLGNTKAYSPIQKGNIEKLIDQVQTRARSSFLGHGQVLKNDGERLAKDTRLEASVTLEELYKITLILVNEYNTAKVNSSYNLSESMLADRVNRIPANIYKWGIENGLGYERVKSAKQLQFVFYEPEPRISINKGGIRVNGQDFVPKDESKGKELKQLESIGERIDIVFNPTKYEECYWMCNNQMIPLRLRGKKDVVFKNRWEAASTMSLLREREKPLKENQETIEIENDKEIAEILKCAKKKQTKVRLPGARTAKAFQRVVEKHKRYKKVIKSQESKPKQPEAIQSKLNQPRWATELKRVNQ